MQLWPVTKLAEHPIINLFCRGDLALPEVREPQRIRNIIILRREFQRRFKLSRGPGKLSAHKPDLSHHVACASALRVADKHLLQRVEGFFILPRVEVSNRQINGYLLRAGLVKGGGFKSRDGLLVRL